MKESNALERAFTKTYMWSQLSRNFNSEQEVVIPENENWILDENMNVGTLTIEGKLTWSLSRRNLELKALYVLVKKVIKPSHARFAESCVCDGFSKFTR